MTVCSAQAVAVAIGAGGSGGAVNGRRRIWCRNTKERQLRAPVVVHARLRAAQSGLGRAGQLAGAGGGSGGSGLRLVGISEC